MNNLLKENSGSVVEKLLSDLSYEKLPLEKKINFIKMKFNLTHGKGKRKRKNKK